MPIDERHLFEAVQLEISPEFRRRLEDDLFALASTRESVVPKAGKLHAERASPRTAPRRAWATLSAAALLIAVSVGITAIALNRPSSVSDRRAIVAHATSTPPAPTRSDEVVSTISPIESHTTTPGAALRPNRTGRPGAPFAVQLLDVHAIDLDRWLQGVPTWSDTDRGGPYVIFDTQRLPIGWSVDSVAGSHPLSGERYLWIAHLSATTAIEATLQVGPATGSFPVDSTPVTIRGRDGHESTSNGGALISWTEAEGVDTSLTSLASNSLPQLEALAESLQPISVDSIGPAPAWPPPGGISFDVGVPELSGSIGGHPWTVDTGDESTTRALYPRVDGVLLGGIDTKSDDPPPGYPIGIAITAVIGGVMVLAVLPSEVDHAIARLSDGSEIEIAGYHWPDRTGIVVPIPHGLDVTSIDFVGANDVALHRIDIPEYPPVVSGGSKSYASELIAPPPLGVLKTPYLGASIAAELPGNAVVTTAPRYAKAVSRNS